MADLIKLYTNLTVVCVKGYFYFIVLLDFCSLSIYPEKKQQSRILFYYKMKRKKRVA